jgi:NADH:ubiquinone oxidoreductase subunit 5 (subunit L)/multisubunit Na+/H+ antiporter MnhA subunit
MYNERPKVRLNATYAFAAYTLADMALLVTVSCMATGTEGVQGAMEGVQGAVSQAFEVTDPESLHAVVSQPLVAAGLLLAAFFKSSQFPLTALFARSMEGPTPSSALGYAGLSAHIGVVLLALNMPLWFEQDWARMAVGGVGLVTAVFSTLVAHTRADRKGAVAYATSATVAQIFVVLAMGYSDTALVLSFGHAAYRMTQILRSPSIIADTKQIRAALGGPMPLRPSIPPVWLYRLAWRCRRIDMDLMDILRAPITMTDSLAMRKLGGQWDPLDLTRSQQWGVTATAVHMKTQANTHMHIRNYIYTCAHTYTHILTH